MAVSSVFITVDGAPVAWGRAQGGKTTKFFTPKKTRNYESFVKMRSAEAMKGKPPFDCAVDVRVVAFTMPPKSFSKKKLRAALDGSIRPTTRPDLDNYIKAALDGMNEIVFRDDNQVVSLSAAKMYSDRPRLEIMVTPMGVLNDGR